MSFITRFIIPTFALVLGVLAYGHYSPGIIRRKRLRRAIRKWRKI